MSLPLSPSQSGASLIEVLIAMLISIVALMGLAALMTSLIRADILSRHDTTATSYAELMIEQVKFSGMTTSTKIIPTPNGYAISVKKQKDTPSVGVTLVTATVTGPGRATLTTLVPSETQP